MSSSLLKIGLGALLEDNPAIADFAKAEGEKAFSVLQAQLTFSAHEISKKYQDSFDRTLEAISDEIAQERPFLLPKIRQEFIAQFADKIASHGVKSDALNIFTEHKEPLFQLEKITQTDLSNSSVAFTDFLLEQMQTIAKVDDKLATFLRHDDLLSKAMLFFLRDQFRTDERFEKSWVVLQQETLLFNQARMLQIMEQLQLSSQLKASDEFTRHNTKTRTIIEKSVLNLKHLPTELPEYNRLALMVGSATSGDLEQAERLFSQVIENTPTDEEKALAYFNLFQVRLRRKAYDKALVDLQAAIAINPEQYALHDVKSYPMVQLLGAGGMGCVFLCGNNNPAIEKKQVVVKCFWETLKGEPQALFKKAVAIHQIVGDYMPEPLEAGYTNERAFFVTEYLEGAINGDTWLEKYGPMDLKTGWQVALQIVQALQLAHDKDIYHLGLKPANLLLKDSPSGVPLKISDFGISTLVPSLQQEALTRQNQAGLSQFGQAVMDTLHYMSPEQQGYTGKTSARSDVFAFGAMMYRFWTALSPQRFSEKNLPKVAGLPELLFDCVEERPNKRPESARQVRNRLKAIKENREKRRKDKMLGQPPVQKKSAVHADDLKGSSAQTAKKRIQVDKKVENIALEQPISLDNRALKAYDNETQGDEHLKGQRIPDKPITQESAEKVNDNTQTKQLLSPLNPLDHLHLLWWTLVTPEKLKNYHKFTNEKSVGKWLLSTLIWLSLLIPILALGLELLPHSAKAWGPEIYMMLSALLAVCWLLTGWLGDIDNEKAFYLTIFMAFCVGSFIAFSIVFGVKGGMTVAMVIGVAILVVGGVTTAMGSILTVSTVGQVAIGMTVGVVFGLSFGLFSLELSLLAGIVAFGLVFGLAGDVEGSIREGIDTGIPSRFARLTFLLLLTSYLFLFAYCFLGGWSLLTR
ncbi:hypothetical protein PN36_30415 [Candidatus Thiomargarita nelsonii]|uniref:Protein kinase domain-containing protein n=1 Tax=Candidatus Thiomargarita nelsonii TaxID=1003181 RepID=A0A0A6P299_9GAMM|nr:hypothetical protein PN36_30415 [Candidatus Thiomargarita nelsonii]